MRNAKVWLFVAFLVIVLAGVMTLTSPAPSANAAAAPKNHWRYHDKHWSYWDDADRRWYYTDGSNWYSRGDDDDAWRVYTFDKGFGREGFERGDYRAPGPDVKIEVPRFGIYRRR